MPVVVAAVEALLDEPFDVQGLQATSDPAAPLVIVSGPVVQQVGINHGIGLFGHGNRANATIGRAVRLVMVNVGCSVVVVFIRVSLLHQVDSLALRADGSGRLTPLPSSHHPSSVDRRPSR
jgi:hypothetical protein